MDGCYVAHDTGTLTWGTWVCDYDDCMAICRANPRDGGVMSTGSGPEFGLTERQKEALIERQAAKIEQLQGAICRIRDERPLDEGLIQFCDAAILGRAGSGGISDDPQGVKFIPITPAEAFDLLTLAAQVDDRTPAQQVTIDRLAAALEAWR
jgi:hypothetical protein